MERDVPTIPADAHADQLLHRLLAHDPVLGRRHAWPLVDDSGALVGMLTRDDLLSAIDRDDETDPRVLEIGTSDLVVAHTDDVLGDALDTMIRETIACLPVVSREEPPRLIGIVSRDGLANAYRAVLEEECVRERGGGTAGEHRLLVRFRGLLRRTTGVKVAAPAATNGAVNASPKEVDEC